jgi:hypothetical protein
MKRSLLTIAFLLVIIFSCSDHDVKKASMITANDIAPVWADLTLSIVKTTPGNTPTFTSRNLGYIGVTMYESTVHGNDDHNSLVGKLNGLEELPMPIENVKYNWALSLNAAQAQILRKLYSHASATNLLKIDSLETVIYNSLHETNTPTAQRSVEFGANLANAIFEWSKSDGGHEGYLHNFDPNYEFPSGASYWTPPTDGQSPSKFPLHPYWGENRTFASANGTLEVPEILPYSTEPTSDYYKQFLEVYDKSKTLTQEEKEISAWWADDPSQTVSPPGHSYNLASIAVRSSKANIYKASEAYAKTGMAVADAFICCWKCKYTYHAERPFPYIKEFIDNNYEKFWPEPPFPAFSSGHSTQSAAAATVLENIFGQNFKVTDNTYEGRASSFQSIEYKSRNYNSIWETAEECAYSRFLGGIHTRQDNEKGTAQGIEIGNNINAIAWK